MGKSTRKKLIEAEEKEQKVLSRLTAHRDSGKHPRGVVTADTEGVMNSILHELEPYYIRPIDEWVYKGKSKDADKQRLSLLRHLCGIYPVPHFLEHPMLVSDTDRSRRPVVTALSTDSKGSIATWYIAVAQGKSLYKTCTSDYLTKKETHLLLQAPTDLDIKGAIWWAKTMSISNDIGDAYRMGKSNFVTRATLRQPFWIDVHRFFTNNPVPLKEMDELLDYIMAEHRDNTNWTIKKRSLEAIRRKSEEWHRAQYKMRHIGGGSWKGLDVPNWKMKTGKYDVDPGKNTEIEWTIHQIVTGNELAKEGQKMRHCVASYKTTCMEGRTGIFSMTSSTYLKEQKRNLTIEVLAGTLQVAQVRGYANRLAHPQENEILRKWAMDNNLRFR